MKAYGHLALQHHHKPIFLFSALNIGRNIAPLHQISWFSVMYWGNYTLLKFANITVWSQKMCEKNSHSLTQNTEFTTQHYSATIRLIGVSLQTWTVEQMLHHVMKCFSVVYKGNYSMLNSDWLYQPCLMSRWTLVGTSDHEYEYVYKTYFFCVQWFLNYNLVWVIAPPIVLFLL